ncbi:Thermophilic metalloprotease (M29) [[Clostridium] polysaccharolyticum]|uniref:Thermophilic metalloprotease (M29) n=2 Tax=[Clostridium] polysaccharolyticum TaxID=29364 RepID=A0A1I0FI18_9FIRM|nr:Thermophilic metalloprotease (M29) [[Clostridium] polysaccharolyticum]
MSYLDQLREENESVKERYELAMDRVNTMLEEKESTWLFQEENENFFCYFQEVKEYLKKIEKTYGLVVTGETKTMALEALQELNHDLYQTLGLDKQESYETSFLNPQYAAMKLGKKDGKLLSFVYTELTGLVSYAFTQRLFDMTIGIELFLEIFGYYNDNSGNAYKDAKSAVYYYISDYSDVRMEMRTRELFDPSLSFVAELIEEWDLNDLRYLYQFGEYIGENELGAAAYLNTLSQKEIDSLAATFTEGYRSGFINNNIDLSKKSTVNIRYNIGFERILKSAIAQFEKMGLKPTIYSAAKSSIHKKKNLKVGYTTTFPVQQFDYDHRFDEGLYLDKGFVERKLATLRMAYEKYKDLAKQFAGPCLIEVFGEVPFEPVEKEEAAVLSEKQQKLMVYYANEAGKISNEYMPGDETSFCIIAFPIPEIGDKFQEIFHETVKVNTLDMDMYREIQQKIIDTLDQGDYVIVKGTNGNLTDIKVKLGELKNPEKETNFENCLADVNIPVGEVFTSPKLEGTNGMLHVTRVFLKGLEYKNLKLVFENGMIKDYFCSNFKEEAKNKKYIEDNLLNQHKSLPIGEFAIGTNTTAYQMGRKYDIQAMLPILIAEKTGPHFAIGDTCYRMSEDLKVYNPDGKEIVARDNECSILRKTDMDKAYFNCHTDITIPYDELGEISVVKKNGTRIPIITEGKFVLEGTERLNDALEI